MVVRNRGWRSVLLYSHKVENESESTEVSSMCTKAL